MQLPKAVKLINLLTNKEIKLVKEKLLRDKKNRLSLLYKQLIKRKKQVGQKEFRAKIYKEVFQEDYQKKKDYRLRNEFRLLTRIIEEILVTQNFQQQLKNNPNIFNYYLLRSLQEKKALDLFQHEYQTTYEEALENMDYYMAYAISSLSFHHYTHFLKENDKNLALAEKINEWEIGNLSSFYLTAYRKHQVHRTLLEHIKHPFFLQEKIKQQVSINFNEYENDYAFYLFKKAQCYLVKGQQRIKLLKECLGLAKENQQKGSVFKEEIKFCLSELAQEYHYLLEFDEASNYYKLFFDLNLPPDDPYRILVVTDYIAKLLRQDRIQEAIEYINREEGVIQAIEKYRIRLRCLKIASFAFSKNTEALFEVLPHTFTNCSQSAKHFYSIYHAIHQYLNGQPVAAEREISNLLNNIMHKKNLILQIQPILRLLKYFFQLKCLPEGAKQIERLYQLDQKIKEYEAVASPEYKGYLPFLWLKKQLTSGLGENHFSYIEQGIKYQPLFFTPFQAINDK